MSWNDEYNVGVAMIDQQHKKLFALIDKLDECLGGQVQKSDIATVVSSLVRYMQAHLLTEERLMLRHGYQDYEQHKQEHDAFTRSVLQFDLRSSEPSMAKDLHDFLIAWWKNHILVTDKRYSPFFARKGIR